MKAIAYSGESCHPFRAKVATFPFIQFTPYFNTKVAVLSQQKMTQNRLLFSTY